MTPSEQIAEDEDARLDVKFGRIRDAYADGFVDGQTKAAKENESIIKSVRAKAFSDGYEAGYDKGCTNMSDFAAEDLRNILASMTTKDLVNELADRINYQ